MYLFKKKKVTAPWETPVDQSVQQICEVLFRWDVSREKKF